MARRKASRQWWAVGGILAVIVALVAVGWVVRDRFLPVEKGSRAPDFAAYDMQGRPVRLSELRGQVVLLNIWATWCPPCREEMPSMQRLHERLGPAGLRIVAVSIDAASGQSDASGRPGGDVEAFLREMGLTFTVWRDPEGGIQRVYRTTGVPESFLIDRDGVIAKKAIGAIEWDSPAIADLVQTLLGT
jgi:thiol-disulfide isomerase/thioredoxin